MGQTSVGSKVQVDHCLESGMCGLSGVRAVPIILFPSQDALPARSFIWAKREAGTKNFITWESIHWGQSGSVWSPLSRPSLSLPLHLNDDWSRVAFLGHDPLPSKLDHFSHWLQTFTESSLDLFFWITFSSWNLWVSLRNSFSPTFFTLFFF